jgi:hypothetical protein
LHLNLDGSGAAFPPPFFLFRRGQILQKKM